MIGVFELVGWVLVVLAATILGSMLFVSLCLVLTRAIYDALRFMREGRELVHDQRLHLQGDRQVARTWKERYELSEAQRAQAEAEVQRLRLYLGAPRGTSPPERNWPPPSSSRALSGVVEEGPQKK